MNEDLVDALAQLSFAVQGAMTEIATEYDLSLVQVRMLGVLRDREPKMLELARHLGLDKSSVSGLVDRAERRSLLTRVASEDDRRSFRVVITARGRELIDAMVERFAAQVEVMTGGLSPAEQRQLARSALQIALADALRHGVDPRIGLLTRNAVRE
ncbi:MarR family winged helix-turn-helix transcriptional regulator [Cryptosporangium sp. NPDC051539]|uniref:MarR family winged helix-turn-helix transcriptional regulator n=1 Tax=Cryptosporangium sp. NPDC051539 TaxID=3363962 RepID=UPI0037B3FED7